VARVDAGRLAVERVSVACVAAGRAVTAHVYAVVVAASRGRVGRALACAQRGKGDGAGWGA
jgi:hypothetical protein